MASDDQLSENRFVHEGIKENPYPFWFWLFLLVIIISLVIGLQTWSRDYFDRMMYRGPFRQVTNREFSLFISQNPQYMEEYTRTKKEYFRQDRAKEEFQDKYVVAPSEVLFHYHTWKRQVKSEFPKRKIDVQEFLEFLDQVPEWNPQHWSDAPSGYADMVERLPNIDVGNLQNLSEENLPNVVRLAFLGWKNEAKEREAIGNMAPTYAQMNSFLAKYPHYARNYWKNIISDQYLHTLSMGNFAPDHTIPTEELASFLKIAFYNEMRKKD